LFNPTISDARGNILGYYDSAQGIVLWNSARPTGYGAVPGYRPLALANGANVAQSSAWRGRWVDITGYHQIGLRPYDPTSGRWLTYDSVWNARDPNYYTFAGGEPIMGFDPDGRCVDSVIDAAAAFTEHTADAVGNLAYNTAGALDYALTSPFAPNWAYQTYGDYAQGFANNVNGMALTTYDVSALATYGLVSPFAPDYAYNNYGGSMERLINQAPALYGGNDQSLPYQITYGALNTAMLFMGGEAGEVGNLGKVGEFSDVARSVSFPEGSFSIADWTGYPSGLTQPQGPFRLLEGAEYDAARQAANQANAALHAADPALDGLQIHEIQPVKFGGSPTDLGNKIPLTPAAHAPYTTWWNQLMRDIQTAPKANP
jgi:RHS repeat-associated protein